MNAGVRSALLFSVLIALVIGASLPAGGSSNAKAKCGSVAGSGQFDGWRARVKVRRGDTSCGVARSVAKELFSNDSVYHDVDFGYWTVKVKGQRWRGDIQSGYWVMNTCHEISGCPDVVGGKALNSQPS
jgi:hypothetical protein